MTDKIRILFLSANPWTTSRILVDEEAREIFEKIQEGHHRDRFELHRHVAARPIDLQRLLLMHQPHIVHFSGHGSKKQKIILGGAPGRGKTVDSQGLANVFALYRSHVRLVILNACFTKDQARSISKVIDYSVGTGKGIGDKAGVSFSGAFYRALGFGQSIRNAFDSAKAELALTKMPRTQGIELFIREDIDDKDQFPSTTLTTTRMRAFDGAQAKDALVTSECSCKRTEGRCFVKTIEERFESRTTLIETSTNKQSRQQTKSEVIVYRRSYTSSPLIESNTNSLVEPWSNESDNNNGLNVPGTPNAVEVGPDP